MTRDQHKTGDGVGDREEQAVMVYYKRGVYLDEKATLKDLRNAFLDSGTCSYNVPVSLHTSLVLGNAPPPPPQASWRKTVVCSSS